MNLNIILSALHVGGSVTDVERIAIKDSVIHSLDGRVKLITLLLVIVFAVYTTQLVVLAILELYLVTLLLLSRNSLKHSFLRVLIIIPFGGSIAILQPFVHGGTVFYTLPLGIHITYQGVMFGLLLLSRLVVTLTCIVLLSSISPMQEVAESFRRLGMPRDFSMIFSLFIRFLFLFYEELGKITHAQTSRNFDIFSKKTAYMWRLKMVAYTVMMMFLKSYERGESVYLSMASRGFSDKSQLYSLTKKEIDLNEYSFVITTLVLIVCLQIMAIYVFPQMGFIGSSIRI
ncbi:MAG: cobalt ECF transporter T component CbiQ [Methanobacterium sp.]|jgi:cobalt/nickel transport system permease protein